MDVMPLPYFEVDVPIRSTDQPGPGLLEHGHQVHQLARPGRRLGSLRGWNTMGTILGVGDFSGDVKADLATVTNDSYDGAECGLPPHVQRPRHGRDRGGRGAGPELVEAERRLLAERSGVNVKTPAPPAGSSSFPPVPSPSRQTAIRPGHTRDTVPPSHPAAFRCGRSERPDSVAPVTAGPNERREERMRPSVMTRAIVSATAVVGLAMGTLAGAGTSFAASAPAAQPTVSAEAFGTLATNNLGLTSKQAKGIQRWVTGWGYTGDIDGLLGTKSWKAIQNYLAAQWDYNDAIDGIAGPNTIKALQRFLKEHSGYTGPIDGIAGPGTRAAWANWANYIG